MCCFMGAKVRISGHIKEELHEKSKKRDKGKGAVGCLQRHCPIESCLRKNDNPFQTFLNHKTARWLAAELATVNGVVTVHIVLGRGGEADVPNSARAEIDVPTPEFA